MRTPIPNQMSIRRSPRRGGQNWCFDPPLEGEIDLGKHYVCPGLSPRLAKQEPIPFSATLEIPDWTLGHPDSHTLKRFHGFATSLDDIYHQVFEKVKNTSLYLYYSMFITRICGEGWRDKSFQTQKEKLHTFLASFTHNPKSYKLEEVQVSAIIDGKWVDLLDIQQKFYDYVSSWSKRR
jgi:hypothetical protein